MGRTLSNLAGLAIIAMTVVVIVSGLTIVAPEATALTEARTGLELAKAEHAIAQAEANAANAVGLTFVCGSALALIVGTGMVVGLLRLIFYRPTAHYIICDETQYLSEDNVEYVEGHYESVPIGVDRRLSG